MTSAPFRLAVSNLAWEVADDHAVGALLVEHGAAGVELAPSRVWPTAPMVPRLEANSYADRWRERGLEVVAFQAIFYGHPLMSLFAEGAALHATQDHLVAMGALAAATGARVLVLGAPRNRRRESLSFDIAIRQAAAAIHPVAESLARHGVRLCIEPNPPRYGCDFVTTAAEATILAEAVDHPNFGIHLDATALALSGETSPEALRPVMPYAHHFHISELDLAPVGTTATVPHAAIGKTLRDLGYHGWHSIEMRATDDDAWPAAIRSALECARRHYHD